MEALARQNPVLMIFEDAHWTDPTSWKCSSGDRLGSSLRELLNVMFRPHFDPPWVGRAYVTLLAVNRLGEREIRDHRGRHRQQAVASQRSPRHHRAYRWHSLVRRGNDEGGVGSGEPGQVSISQRQFPVPHCLSRQPASIPKGTAGPPRPGQGGGADRSAMGREFSHSLLAAVVRKPEAEMGLALDRLIAAGLRFQQACRRTRPICLNTTGTGRGLWHAVVRTATSASRPHCRDP